jgi:hypothetical protein
MVRARKSAFLSRSSNMARVIILFLLLTGVVSAGEQCDEYSRTVLVAYNLKEILGVKGALDFLTELTEPNVALRLVVRASKYKEEENPMFIRVSEYLECLEVME